jgi:PD-(D/E)XK endonuclease
LDRDPRGITVGTGRELMAPLKLKGDRAEIEVARDLITRGFRVAIPYGEDWDFDLIFSDPAAQLWSESR